MSETTVDDRARYRANPTVLQALKSPRMLTREVLAGLVVGLALIPEAIAFSVIAGVDPKVGLFSSFIMAVSIAFLGGRPAMVTAATGAVALVIAPVAPTYGLDYFIATVILAGIFQVVLGVLGVAKLMRFYRPVDQRPGISPMSEPLPTVILSRSEGPHSTTGTRHLTPDRGRYSSRPRIGALGTGAGQCSMHALRRRNHMSDLTPPPVGGTALRRTPVERQRRHGSPKVRCVTLLNALLLVAADCIPDGVSVGVNVVKFRDRMACLDLLLVK